MPWNEVSQHICLARVVWLTLPVWLRRMYPCGQQPVRPTSLI
jgi:hypothetical protein